MRWGIFLFTLGFNAIDISLGGQKGSEIPIKLIPTPESVTRINGVFEIGKTTTIVETPEAGEAIRYLNERFTVSAGYRFGIRKKSSGSKIAFVRDAAMAETAREAYTLSILPAGITVGARHRAGYFYAVQTLMQLLPPEILESKRTLGISWKLPCVIIKDSPKYSWRSFMLDSGRQYQTKEFIKRYLDYLAMLKINVFHWHLTEGQGWRIEIRKYPELTAIGSAVADGKEQQGFYSQDNIREIVKYASDRCITVVPEIDVPGHSEAALIAHPELTCFGKKPLSVMEYSQDLFCAGKESTYTFLKNVLDEVCELFPGEYVHLGGDEAPKGNWNSCPDCQAKMAQEQLANSHALQIYFSTRLANHLKQKGKRVILWGDIVEQSGPKLPDNVIIYWWNYRKNKAAAYHAALENGYQVICGTNYYTYLNFPITPWSRYKADRTFDMKMVYEQNPSDIANPRAQVLGMGACLWTDWNVTMSMIDQRVFPRVYALSEQMWSKAERMSFEDFYEKVQTQIRRMVILGISAGPALRELVPGDYSWEQR
jgi:N-acetyl-beta-hexosaminidase